MKQGKSNNELDKLLFRRQFVLSPAPLRDLSSWQQLEIGGQFSLQAHPDLEVLQLAGNGIELTLLGYLIDPHNSDLDNYAIIEKLIETVREPEGIFEKTERYGGRWILIFHQNNETILFNDPAGCRQIFFTDASEIQQTFCSSQPSIIVEELDLIIDEDVREQFIEPQIPKDREYWLPGELSPYKGIRHLLPNHYLCLKTRSVHRFWPRARLQAINPRQAVEKSCAILRGQWAGIAKRFDLAMTITAGMDSRTIFAASKDVCNRVYFYTFIFKQMTEESPDIRIPSRLLSRFGLKHHVIKSPSAMDADFREIYMRNVTLAHDFWGSIIQGLYREYPQDKIAVEGSCSEIGRCWYHRYGEHPPEISAEMLADMTEMAHTPFIIASFDRWLGEARVVEKEYGIKILDLFFWEQREGVWNAWAQQELDIVQESFSPFNCRELLTILLAVDERLRKEPNYHLYRDIIYQLWPDALKEPINPVPIEVRLR